jgi:uncharacterized protein YjbI with pentapeptide repeats
VFGLVGFWKWKRVKFMDIGYERGVSIMEEKCTYDDKNKECNCILHCEKDSWNSLEKDELNKKIELFWKTLRDTLYSSCQNINEICVVEGIIFSKWEEALNFNYPIDINEENGNFTCKILFASERTYYFKNCAFLEKLDLKELDLEKDLTFDNCTFNQEITFYKSCNSSLIFINDCDFYSNNIDLSNRIFKSNLYFKNCKNIKKLDLYNSTIQGSASFRGSNLNEVNFEKTEFNNVAVFNDTIFQNNVDFKYTSFDDRVYFQDVTIQGELNLSSTIFKDEVNFLGIKNNEVGKKLGVKNIANRETARIIKHSFEKLDNIIEANKFYALEMQKREEELSKTKENWLDWIVFKFHKISSNHSQDWLLTLLWMLNITMLFGTFSNISPCQKDIGLFIVVSLMIIVGLYTLLKTHRKKFLFAVFIFIYCLSSINLDDMARLISLTGKESLTFITLIYKSIIAYLIYQFIISIRQNTRRK